MIKKAFKFLFKTTWKVFVLWFVLALAASYTNWAVWGQHHIADHKHDMMRPVPQLCFSWECERGA